MIDRINPGFAPQSFLQTIALEDVATDKAIEDVISSAAIDVGTGKASVPVTKADVLTHDIDTKAHTGTTDLASEVTVAPSVPAEGIAVPPEPVLVEEPPTVPEGKAVPAEGKAVPPEGKADKAVPAVVKDALTGAGKPEALKTNVEHFCDEHWHQVAVALITTMIIFGFAIVIMVMLGIIKVSASFTKMNGANKLSLGNGKLDTGVIVDDVPESPIVSSLTGGLNF